jgi:hypothetical protein
MADFDTGMLDTIDNNGAGVILDLKDGLDWLEEAMGGVKLLKKLGTNGFTYANQKIEWDETELMTRRQAITVTDVATAVDVVDARQFQVNNLLRCENEVMRVTAIADDNTLTVVRGYAGTTAVAHTAAQMFSLGAADPEGAEPPEGIQTIPDRLFNYSQTLTRSVKLSKDQIAELQSGGNPMVGQLKQRFVEINQELFQALVYGVRYKDSTNKIYTMGGFKQFVTTNVTNVGGAVTVAVIDAKIKAIVDAGGDPKIIAVSTTQKQKLDALDASLVRLGLREKHDNVGGNPRTMTWQSGILDHDLEIVVDNSFLPDELHIWDTDYIEIGHKSHNGVVGNFHVEDATVNGADNEHKLIRGKYSARFRQEKAHAYLYGLTT